MAKKEPLYPHVPKGRAKSRLDVLREILAAKTVEEVIILKGKYRDVELTSDDVEAIDKHVACLGTTEQEPASVSRMEVRLWTGTRIPVSDREEAVRVIKRELEGWMEKGDRIAWYKKQETDPLPSIAYVMDSVGELTDASAIIVSKR